MLLFRVVIFKDSTLASVLIQTMHRFINQFQSVSHKVKSNSMNGIHSLNALLLTGEGSTLLPFDHLIP